MKHLYIECNMGAAGDMLLGALTELTGEPEAAVQRLNGLGIPNTEITRETVTSCGILGARLLVKIHGTEELEASGEQDDPHEGHSAHHHSATKLADIDDLIEGLPVSERVRTDAKNIYRLIAYAESEAHGKPVSQIHFHEVGMLDAVVDVVGCAMLMEALAPEVVTVSTIRVGGGTVHCAHGEMPVPAPATALLLNGMPVQGGPYDSELCTPTGAAIIKYFAGEFGSMPAMRVERIGSGYGKKTFPAPNCVRMFYGETLEEARSNDTVVELRCNLDDMTGEQLGFASEVFLASGAKDVFITPVLMKKGRPGHLLTLLCNESETEKMVELLFLHTSTLGIRKTICQRYVLQRREEPVNTSFGSIRMKSAGGFGVEKAKPEYEDAAAAAKAADVPLAQVTEEAFLRYRTEK